jgi:uncharacterized protein YjhX (UPF0386 family)
MDGWEDSRGGEISVVADEHSGRVIKVSCVDVEGLRTHDNITYEIAYEMNVIETSGTRLVKWTARGTFNFY